MVNGLYCAKGRDFDLRERYPKLTRRVCSCQLRVCV